MINLGLIRGTPGCNRGPNTCHATASVDPLVHSLTVTSLPVPHHIAVTGQCCLGGRCLVRLLLLSLPRGAVLQPSTCNGGGRRGEGSVTHITLLYKISFTVSRERWHKCSRTLGSFWWDAPHTTTPPHNTTQHYTPINLITHHYTPLHPITPSRTTDDFRHMRTYSQVHIRHIYSIND